MKIVVCYKVVRDSQQIKEAPDGKLIMSEAEEEIGQYDLNAVEAGVRLAAENEGSRVIALTCADSSLQNMKMRKGILSRGPAELYTVGGAGFDEADSYVVADALKKAVEKIGDVDLVICGEGSGDMYAQQMGIMLGAMLGMPTVNGVSSIKVDGNMLELTRELEKTSEDLKVELPAVISVTSSINTPRIPALRDIMQAGKKPVTMFTKADLGLDTEATVLTQSILAPEKVARRQEIYTGLTEETADNICRQLLKTI